MSDGNIETRKLVTRLLVVVVAMFAFGFALVPIYNVMCKALGINGKTSGSAYQGGLQQVDMARQVKVDFVANKAERGQIREEKEEQASNASVQTRQQAGEESGAQLMMIGQLNSIVDQEGGKAVVF